MGCKQEISEIGAPGEFLAAHSPMALLDPEECLVAPYPGHTVCQDALFVCEIKGIGDAPGLRSIYVQTALDAYCSLGFAKVYPTRSSLTAVDLLRTRVLPFYEAHAVKIHCVLTDNRKEYCGAPLVNPFETFLSVSRIQHHQLDGGRLAENPFCEAFHQTLKQEFFGPVLRKFFRPTFDLLQSELDIFLRQYNQERPCFHNRCKGKTPLQAFLDGVASIPVELAAAG